MYFFTDLGVQSTFSTPNLPGSFNEFQWVGLRLDSRETEVSVPRGQPTTPWSRKLDVNETIRDRRPSLYNCNRGDRVTRNLRILQVPIKERGRPG